VVSIYVNPTQFNDKNDLLNYPRCLPDDLDLLGRVLRENDIVFTPDDREMYPEEDKRIFNFGDLDNVMEALHRPGHFNGVAQVVSKLFEMVNPDIAFFGQKDFQQVAVIRELVRQMNHKVKIIACPIVREKDGLAMSSRNQLLEPQIRKEASVIYSSVSAAAVRISGQDIPSLKDFVKRKIEEKEGFKLEYFEIVDDRELKPVSSRKDMESRKKYFGCIAVRAGKIRLIDNIEIPL
jgi:pantoate--beta-alanine ligase